MHAQSHEIKAIELNYNLMKNSKIKKYNANIYACTKPRKRGFYAFYNV